MHSPQIRANVLKKIPLLIFLGFPFFTGCTASQISFQKQAAVTLEEATNKLNSFGGRPELLSFCQDIRFLAASRSFACLRGGKWGLIGTDGRLLIKPVCQELIFNNYQRRNSLTSTYLCKINNYFALFKSNGQQLTEPEYSAYFHQNGFKKDIIATLKDNKLGLINSRGETILAPLYDSFNCAAFYSDRFTKDDQLCQINQGQKVGAIRSNGQLIFDAVCDRVEVGGLINNWTYKCIKGEYSHYYSHRLELLRIAPTADDLAGNYRRRKMP